MASFAFYPYLHFEEASQYLRAWPLQGLPFGSLWTAFFDEGGWSQRAFEFMLLSRFIIAFVLLFSPLSLIVMWWVHSMDRTLMPDGIASTLVAVYPFLLTTFLAVDCSETCFDL